MQVSTTKLSAAQPTVLMAGAVRHHGPRIGPWWTNRAMIITAGTATKKGHETETADMPTSSTANGESTTTQTTVKTAA
ncbi:MAG: hypothetical protein DCC48_15375 [Acidobacteria bacterium]|nr:MAG: hypothetical protein DCC48_15375 [Acidobacteriota bacterium]